MNGRDPTDGNYLLSGNYSTMYDQFSVCISIVKLSPFHIEMLT